MWSAAPQPAFVKSSKPATTHPPLLLERKIWYKLPQSTSCLHTSSVPEPWPSSVAKMVNPVSGLQPLANSASAESTSRRRISRQPSTARWCALGTQVYIVLALQGTQGAGVVMSMLKTAIHQVETQMANQTAEISTTGIAAGSAPVYKISGTNSEITANNAPGVNMTWQELELGLLMISDWMGKNTYGWGSASVWNGTDEVGLIYITE